MITRALQHCRGLGPVRLAELHQVGVQTWSDVLARPELVSSVCRSAVVGECRRCLEAQRTDNIGYFVERFHPKDRWRILAEYHQQVSFFDIETAGLDYEAPITVIVCWHRGRLHTFIEHENLDDFVELLDDVSLLASFNGASFDVPRVLDAFHLPGLPCPHLDLRWICHHQGASGGLKSIARRNRIKRPADLDDLSGVEAIELWQRWQSTGDPAARDLLIRYCAADVLLLVELTNRLTGSALADNESLWEHLPIAAQATMPVAAVDGPASSPQTFGPSGPQKLRALRLRRTG